MGGRSVGFIELGVELVFGDGEEGVEYLNMELYWLRCDEVVEVR